MPWNFIMGLKNAVNKQLPFAAAAAFLFLFAPGRFVFPVGAQSEDEELRAERAEKAEEMRRTEDISGSAFRIWKEPTKKRGLLFDYGSTLAPAYTTSENNDRNGNAADPEDRTWAYDFDLYGLLVNVDRSTKFYFRAASKFTDAKKLGNSSPGKFSNRFDGPKIDMLYWERKMQGRVFNHTLTIGRQFSKVGRGIAYGITADGILWGTKTKKTEARWFWMRQNPGDNNVDPSSPGSGRTKRWFTAAEFKYKRWKQTADFFALINRDRNDERALGGQKYRLDSEYYGLGLEGAVFSKLSYWSEFIMENGKTYPNGGTTKVGMDAEAFDAGVRYFWGGAIAPSIYAEYAYGSGDADRTATNVSSSKGGSTFGDDSVFRAFGGLSMGNALSPGLANIRIYKVGASVKPFGRAASDLLSDMTMQSAFYMYRTAAKGGATSDPKISTGANAKSDDIGDEIDFQISWKMLSDLTHQFKFGQFNPGPAYTNRAKEQYMKLKWTFDL